MGVNYLFVLQEQLSTASEVLQKILNEQRNSSFQPTAFEQNVPQDETISVIKGSVMETVS